ncbi:MAG: hypothetical protein AAF298_24465 [Cyanobacteria bacterium P01_A01_bin.40]
MRTTQRLNSNLLTIHRNKLPNIELLNETKYLNHAIFHLTIQGSFYPLRLKLYAIQEDEKILSQFKEAKQKQLELLTSKGKNKKEAKMLVQRNEHFLVDRYIHKLAKSQNSTVSVFNSSFLKGKKSIIKDLDSLQTKTGWEGKEKNLEDLITQLLNYTNISVTRQMALRNNNIGAKILTRSPDMVLFYKYLKNEKTYSSLICIELKTNYIAETDVTDCWYTRKYLHKLIKIFPHVNDATMLFLSLKGLTEAANIELGKINEQEDYIRKKYYENQAIFILISSANNKVNVVHPNIQAYSTTVSQFIDTVYLCARYAYRDEQGAIGQHWSRVKPDIEQIIWKIKNPQFWLEDYLKIENKIK